MVHGIIVIYNEDKKEYEMFAVDVVHLTDAQLSDVKAGTASISLTMYKTDDAYKALRLKKTP